MVLTKRFDIALVNFKDLFFNEQNLKLMFLFYVMIWQQEREYKEALDTFNEKNREKVQLITKLMEVSFELLVIVLLNNENKSEFYRAY